MVFVCLGRDRRRARLIEKVVFSPDESEDAIGPKRLRAAERNETEQESRDVYAVEVHDDLGRARVVREHPLVPLSHQLGPA